jgi:hypothetical protein
MTTDFLVDILRHGKTYQEAWYVKPASELEKSRVLEKLEIERRFWVEQDIPLRIATEKEFSPALTKISSGYVRSPLEIRASHGKVSTKNKRTQCSQPFPARTT